MSRKDAIEWLKKNGFNRTHDTWCMTAEERELIDNSWSKKLSNGCDVTMTVDLSANVCNAYVYKSTLPFVEFTAVSKDPSEALAKACSKWNTFIEAAKKETTITL